MDIFYCFLGCIIVILVGLLVGFMAGKCIGNNKKQTLFLTAAFSTSDHLLFIIILCQIIGPYIDSIQPVQPGELTADKRALMYIALITVIMSFWKWTICYYMVQKEPTKEDKEKILQEREMQIFENNDENEEEAGEYTKLVDNKIKSVPEKLPDLDEIEPLTWKSLLNIPICTCLVTLIFVFIPPVQNYFNTNGTLANVTLISVNILVGKTYGFLCMFMLGLFISETLHWNSLRLRPKENQFMTVADMIWITSLKLILMPLIVLPILILFFHYLMKPDIALIYVFFILAASPFDINMNVICGYKNAYIETCALINTVMFIVSVLTYMLQSTLGIYTLGYISNVVVVTPEKPVAPVNATATNSTISAPSASA